MAEGSDTEARCKANSSSKAHEPWENSNHALYLHHSDQPGAVLVTQPLMEDNFSEWTQSMSMALKIKNKLGFVLGTQTKSLVNLEEQQQWERCDTLVKTWLIASMSKTISCSIKNCKTSRDVWTDLQERFGQTNTVQLFNVENGIHACLQGSDSVTTYFTKLKSLWDERDVLCGMESCTCAGGVKMVEYIKNQKTMKFLMGLNEGYDTLRSNIVAIDPLPAVNKAYAMALRHEKQAAAALGNKSVVQPEGAVFAVKHSGDGETNSDDGKRCTKCNKKYHTAQNCRAHLKCSYCNWKGHDYEHCRKRKAADASRSNNVISGIEGSIGAPSFPFSQEVCRQLIEMLNKNAAASTNHIGNTPSHQNLSGPTIGEDDWDGP